jgi:hypothetical protein
VLSFDARRCRSLILGDEMYTIGGKVKDNAFLGTGQVTPLSATSSPTSRVDGASTRGGSVEVVDLRRWPALVE